MTSAARASEASESMGRSDADRALAGAAEASATVSFPVTTSSGRTGLPQLPQKLASCPTAAPHCGHTVVRAASLSTAHPPAVVFNCFWRLRTEAEKALALFPKPLEAVVYPLSEPLRFASSVRTVASSLFALSMSC